MENARTVAFCPHCCNTAPQRLLHVQHLYTYGYHLDGTRDPEPDLPCAYFVAACETCHELLVYYAQFDVPKDSSFTEADLVFPNPGFLPEVVPQKVRTCYDEAARIRSIAPNAFAVQVRRALEALCEDRGAPSGPLHARLKSLADKGDIPPVLAEVTDVLRLLGNIGAHSTDQAVKPWDTRVIDEFFRAVVEYVYVAPSKIKTFRETLAAPQNTARDEADA